MQFPSFRSNVLGYELELLGTLARLPESFYTPPDGGPIQPYEFTNADVQAWQDTMVLYPNFVQSFVTPGFGRATSGSAMFLTPVPEPSSHLLFATMVPVLALLLLRRRASGVVAAQKVSNSLVPGD